MAVTHSYDLTTIDVKPTNEQINNFIGSYDYVFPLKMYSNNEWRLWLYGSAEPITFSEDSGGVTFSTNGNLYRMTQIGNINLYAGSHKWNKSNFPTTEIGEPNTAGIYYTYTAKVGDQFPAPEPGWKRYDDTHPAIKYDSSILNGANTSSYNNGTHYINTSNSSGKSYFKFKGTKIRLIGRMYSDLSTITIDGIKENISRAEGYQSLYYEKTGLNDIEHTVEVALQCGSISPFVVDIDAIDIDSDGRLLHPDEVTDPKDLVVGKRIRCHYLATANAVGVFSGLGEETSDFIPTASTNVPNGDFYFILVDEGNGKKKLIADRDIQHSVSWDVLNTAGIASGSGLPIKIGEEVVPKMSRYNENGYTVFANPTNYSAGSYEAWMAFDKVETPPNIWSTPSGIRGGHIGVILPEPEKIRGYSITCHDNNQAGGRSPKTWGVYGSNDGETWDLLDYKDTGVFYNGSLTKVYFGISTLQPYSYYKIDVQTTNLSNAFCLQLSEIQFYREETEYDNYNLTTRLLTGGISATDKDNEWDKYIVNSSLDGTITPGDNSVWNWSGVWGWTSTVWTTAANRIVRGNSIVNGHSHTPSSSTTSTIARFRPVLEIESLIPPTQDRTLIFSEGEYKKYGKGRPAVVGGDLVPTMTSNTSPSGVASASKIQVASYDAWKAFDDDLLTYWYCGFTVGTEEWLEYQFTQPTKIVGYSIIATSQSDSRYTPTGWKLEGFDGTRWIMLDEVTGQTLFTPSEKRTFNLEVNTDNYIKYRLTVGATGTSGGLSLGGLELLEEESPANPPSWETVSATLPTQAQFQEEGMEDLTIFDRKVQTIVVGMVSTELGGGKVFKGTVDLKKYFDLRKMEVK